MSTTDSGEKHNTTPRGKATGTRSKVATVNPAEKRVSENMPAAPEQRTKKPAATSSPARTVPSAKAKPQAAGTDPYQSGHRVWPD